MKALVKKVIQEKRRRQLYNVFLFNFIDVNKTAIHFDHLYTTERERERASLHRMDIYTLIWGIINGAY
jgi:hypothetical protein